VSRVGIARTRPDYRGLAAPWPPGARHPELASLAGAGDDGSPPNHVFAAVRAALCAAGLDEAHFGSAAWNPLGALVAPGGTVVLKPNFIRHWNPEPRGSLASVVTHGAVVRAAADYAFLAVGPEGRVVLAEAPQMDCDFERIREAAGLDALASHYAALDRSFEVIDLRREWTRFEDGIIVERTPLPGDPAGYRAVDLGERSFFAGSGLDPDKMRGADYDPGPTAEHHRDGHNAYLLSETVLRADLVVNLPKLKTHKKTGVTLALKNLVGINGDKNWLPHHCVGSPATGGDEFPGERLVDRLRSRLTEIARPLLHRGRGLPVFRLYRRVERAARGDEFIRAGNWHGNDTTWRMCVDLNRCLYYSDAHGARFGSDRPVRTVLTVVDGVVAGEGAGPLAPVDRPLGAVLAGTDPVAVDLAAIALMGFDAARIPKVREAMASDELRVTDVRDPGDVEPFEADLAPDTEAPLHARPCTLASLAPETPFEPHAGWKGHIEATP